MLRLHISLTGLCVPHKNYLAVLVESLATHLGSVVLTSAGELLHAGVLAPPLAVGLKHIPANRAIRCPLSLRQNLWIDRDSQIPITLVSLDRASSQAIVGGSLVHVWRSRW